VDGGGRSYRHQQVCSATGDQLGTIATTGTNTMMYTAPAGPLPISPCGVVVTATSNEDNTTSGQALGERACRRQYCRGTAHDRAASQHSIHRQCHRCTDGVAGQDIQWSAVNGGAFDNPIYNNGSMWPRR
jgi:hypothetical protein